MATKKPKVSKDTKKSKTKKMLNSQYSDVVEYLNEHGSITRVEGLIDLGIANMPAVISELRNKFGYDIVTYEVPFKTKYGRKSTYAKWTKNW